MVEFFVTIETDLKMGKPSILFQYKQPEEKPKPFFTNYKPSHYFNVKGTHKPKDKSVWTEFQYKKGIESGTNRET